MKIAPFSALVEEAAEPHMNRGKDVLITDHSEPSLMVNRQPEILHGIRNLIQNGVDFADTTVWVDLQANPQVLKITICDDGPGYPAHVFARLGEPFVSQRTRSEKNRVEYEGMGLGLFIAKTLLERSGAELTFANGTDPFLTASENAGRKGAFVEVSWQTQSLQASEAEYSAGLGENQINAI